MAEITVSILIMRHLTGGGILNEAHLTVRDSSIQENDATPVTGLGARRQSRLRWRDLQYGELDFKINSLSAET